MLLRAGLQRRLALRQLCHRRRDKEAKPTQENTKNKLAKALGISASTIRNHNDLGHFDVIVTNPPFGSKIPIKDQQILEQYEIGYIWNKDEEGNWFQTDRLQSSVPPEQLFIERIIQLLKEGGRTAIVLPDSILGAPGLEYIRHWLIKKTKIIEFKKKIKRNRFFILSVKLFPKNLKQ